MFSLELLKQMIDRGYVGVNKHPEADLYIYNYTPAAQYDQYWNEVTLQCRGLILDEALNVVARPFRKFFNLGERPSEELPGTSFEVQEKMDGSLGILYWIGDTPYIASRGSFDSVQARRANQMLYEQYKASWSKLDKEKTYLFEIIYPENRIVVHYGQEESLVLLAVIDKASGAEEALPDIGFPLVRRYEGITDYRSLRYRTDENKEGFVLLFQNGLRLKIKLAEYIRLHRILTQVSNLTIWEYLKTGKDIRLLLEQVPDEFFNWVKKTKAGLEEQYSKIENTALAEFKPFVDRKEAASYYYTCTYPKILFCMLDNKPYAHIIWEQIRPVFSKPFMNIE